MWIKGIVLSAMYVWLGEGGGMCTCAVCSVVYIYPQYGMYKYVSVCMCVHIYTYVLYGEFMCTWYSKVGVCVCVSALASITK